MKGRKVKRINGRYTLGSIDHPDRLCTSCGKRVVCSLLQAIEDLRVNKQEANIDITSCASYMPQLAFRDDAGMESEFNTFRLGGMWAQRLHPGQYVLLVKASGEAIGVGVVQSIHVGSLGEMIDAHGFDNHLSLAASRKGKELDMLKVMKVMYGSTRVGINSMTTVVYLKRGRNHHEGEAQDRALSSDELGQESGDPVPGSE